MLRPDGRHWWLDLGLPEEKFGSEYDGAAFHGPDRRAHDLARRAWLRDTAGWQLEVFDRSRVYGPDQDATDALARAWRRHRHGC